MSDSKTNWTHVPDSLFLNIAGHPVEVHIQRRGRRSLALVCDKAGMEPSELDQCAIDWYERPEIPEVVCAPVERKRKQKDGEGS